MVSAERVQLTQVLIKTQASLEGYLSTKAQVTQHTITTTLLHPPQVIQHIMERHSRADQCGAHFAKDRMPPPTTLSNALIILHLWRRGAGYGSWDFAQIAPVTNIKVSVVTT